MKNKDQEIKKPNFKTAPSDENFKNYTKTEEQSKQSNHTQNISSDTNALKKEIESKNSEIISLRKQLDDLNSKFKSELEAKANKAQELVNQKIEEVTKKANEEIVQIKKYAIKDNAEELINIVSQINSVIASSENNPDPSIKNYVVGFKMYMNMFENLFSSMGIKLIPVKVGDIFDEKVMEAIDTEQNPSIKSGHVCKIIKSGYMLHDRVLIHCQVVVSK